jgi:hypothetical protein
MLRIGQSGLLLADRSDGSMGRSVTTLTSEDSVETRHFVVVGVTTHHLHSVDTLAVVTRTPGACCADDAQHPALRHPSRAVRLLGRRLRRKRRQSWEVCCSWRRRSACGRIRGVSMTPVSERPRRVRFRRACGMSNAPQAGIVAWRQSPSYTDSTFCAACRFRMTHRHHLTDQRLEGVAKAALRNVRRVAEIGENDILIRAA